MHAVTIKEAQRDLERLLTQVVDDAEPTIVVLESGQQVVVAPLDDYTAWQETTICWQTRPMPRICGNPSLKRVPAMLMIGSCNAVVCASCLIGVPCVASERIPQ